MITEKKSTPAQPKKINKPAGSISSNAGGDGSKVPATNSKYDFIKKIPHIRVSNWKIENKYKHIL